MHRISYTVGPHGLQEFQRKLAELGIRVDNARVTFRCRSPDSGAEIVMKGLEAYAAATYCASINAAKRLQGEPGSEPSVTDSSSSSSGSNGNGSNGRQGEGGASRRMGAGGQQHHHRSGRCSGWLEAAKTAIKARLMHW